MVCGQSGLMVHAPRHVVMELGQGTGHVLDPTVEAVSAWALMSCKWSATRDLAEVCHLFIVANLIVCILPGTALLFTPLLNGWAQSI